jgi:hypothetical protein
MFAIMPSPPIFQESTALFRPAAPSPLSSSPIRASSPHNDEHTISQREVKSSPIRAPKFKFASRAVRQNPVVQKREVTQAARRTLFLKNVRQRADDQKWERRGGDQEVHEAFPWPCILCILTISKLLKLEWWSLNRELRQAKNSDVEGVVSEAEIEAAANLVQLPASTMQHDADEMMADTIAEREEAELDAMISSFAQQTASSQISRPDSPHFSDDEDYDALFTDFLSQENQGGGTTGDVEMT